MTDDLQAAYDLSARPYLEAPGPVPAHALALRSWRYLLEINSACNLHCSLCHAGNRGGYCYRQGVMDLSLLARIADKIQRENPEAIVCAYVNSEPFLHPHLAEAIQIIKARGLWCEISSNLNLMPNVDEVLAAKPDLFTVSVSGFTQGVYERAHRGGDIERVKANLTRLAEANREHGVAIRLNYHRYNYNLGDEMEWMKAFAESVGIGFETCWARAISAENTVQACRELERQRGELVRRFEVKGDLDLNTLLPDAKSDFIAAMEQLRFHPLKAKRFYARFPVAPVCLIADVFTEIRWDGKVQLCCWTDDMRLTLGYYLDMSQEEISAARRGHPLCRECLRLRLNCYMHIVDADKWDEMDQF